MTTRKDLEGSGHGVFNANLTILWREWGNHISVNRPRVCLWTEIRIRYLRP